MPVHCCTGWMTWGGGQSDTKVGIISGKPDERLACSLRQDKHFMLKCLQRLFRSPVNKRVSHAEVEKEELYEHG